MHVAVAVAVAGTASAADTCDADDDDALDIVFGFVKNKRTNERKKKFKAGVSWATRATAKKTRIQPTAVACRAINSTYRYRYKTPESPAAAAAAAAGNREQLARSAGADTNWIWEICHRTAAIFVWL